MSAPSEAFVRVWDATIELAQCMVAHGDGPEREPIDDRLDADVYRLTPEETQAIRWLSAALYARYPCD